MVGATGFAVARAGASRRLAVWVTFLSIVSFGAFFYSYPADKPAAYFLMPMRFWELGLGCMLSFLAKAERLFAPPDTTRAVGGLAMATLLAVLLTPMLSGVWATAGVVLLTAVLINALKPTTLPYVLLTLKPVVHIGRLSYSLYLWHWGVLAISVYIVRSDAWWVIPFQVAAMLSLAAASYRWVERPTRAASWGKSTLAPISIGFSVAVFGAATILLLGPLHKRLYLGEPEGIEVLDAHPPLEWSSQCVFADNDDRYRSVNLAACLLNRRYDPAKESLFVIGHSFVWAEYRMFTDERLLRERNVFAFSFAGLTPARELPHHQPRRTEVNLMRWDDAWPLILGAVKPGDVVFVVHRLSEYFSRHADPNGDKRRLLAIGLEHQAVALAARGGYLIVQGGLPLAREARCDPSLVLRAWFTVGGRCSVTPRRRSEMAAQLSPLSSMLDRLSNDVPNLSILDVFDYYCPETHSNSSKHCPLADVLGRPIWRDIHGHPGDLAAASSAKALVRSLELTSSSTPMRDRQVRVLP